MALIGFISFYFSIHLRGNYILMKLILLFPDSDCD